MNKSEALNDYTITRRTLLLRNGERVAAGRIPLKVDFEAGYEYGFRAGCEAVAAACEARAANHYHPKYQNQCNQENDYLLETVEDILGEVSPDVHAKWKKVKAHYMLLRNAKEVLNRVKRPKARHEALKAAIELAESENENH